jgi:hypothetical protein
MLSGESSIIHGRIKMLSVTYAIIHRQLVLSSIETRAFNSFVVESVHLNRTPRGVVAPIAHGV